MITLDDVDRMAIETLTLTGEITIRENTPPSPSVGWPGSDTTEGVITGNFQVPASVVLVGPRLVEPEIQTIDCDPWPLRLYIQESLLIEIVNRADIVSERPYELDIIDISTSPPEDGRTLVEFKVVVK